MLRSMIRVGVMALAIGALSMRLAIAAQPTFETPEDALEALRGALATDDGTAVLALLGPEHRDELIGADPAAARQNLDAAQEAATQGLRLAPGADDKHRVILIGVRDWPLPIPLVKDAKGWRFDTKAGLEEIVDRRVGANELAAIDTARAYADAQRLYFSADRNGDQVQEYAQKLVSTKGQKDGLYWDDPTGNDPSPLGPLAASESEYAQYRQAGKSLHGYHYKILTEQGRHPPAGAYNYVINGHMIAGFGLLAWPADYGSSGIMTFAINQQGKLYQKDLGPRRPRSCARSPAMTRTAAGPR